MIEPHWQDSLWLTYVCSKHFSLYLCACVREFSFESKWKEEKKTDDLKQKIQEKNEKQNKYLKKVRKIIKKFETERI